MADTTLVIEFLFRLLFGTFVFNCNTQTFIKVRKFTQTYFYGVVVEYNAFEYIFIGHKGNLGTRLVRRADNLKFALRNAAIIDLFIMIAVLEDLDFEPFGKRVNDGQADAVQTARNLVTAAAELTACVQLGKNDLNSRNALGMVNTRRNTAPVIENGTRSVGIYGHAYGITIPGKRLVYRVIDNFLNKVMQTAQIGGTDIHTRSFSDVLKPLENLYLTFAVLTCNFPGFFLVH